MQEGKRNAYLIATQTQGLISISDPEFAEVLGEVTDLSGRSLPHLLPGFFWEKRSEAQRVNIKRNSVLLTLRIDPMNHLHEKTNLSWFIIHVEHKQTASANAVQRRSLQFINTLVDNLRLSRTLNDIARTAIAELISFAEANSLQFWRFEGSDSLCLHDFGNQQPELEVLEPLLANTVREEKILYVADFADASLDNETCISFLQKGISTCILLPVKAGQQYHFVIGIYYYQPREFAASLWDALRSLVKVLEMLISSTVFFEELQLEYKQRAESEQRYRTLSERYQSFLNLTAEGIALVEMKQAIPLDKTSDEIAAQLSQYAAFTECNRSLAAMAGQEHIEALTGQSLSMLMSPDQIRAFTEKSLLVEFNQSQFEFRTTSDQEQWISCTSTALVANNHLLALWLICSDVTEQHQHLAELQYQATHDLLTGLSNRKALISDLNSLLRYNKQHELQSALIILDLEHFKDVNDTFGHPFGDLILKLVTKRLQDSSRGRPIGIYRLASDEFGILMRQVEDLNDAQSFAYRVLATLRLPIEQDGSIVELDGHMGISHYPSHGETPVSLLRCADIALQKAQENGQSIELFQAQYDRIARRRLSILGGLRQALALHELQLVYQPKADLKQRRLSGFEALLRWFPHGRDPISPAEFIPLAEMSNHIHALTRWIVGEAIQQLVNFQKAFPDITVAINISSRNLQDSKLPAFISSQCEHYGVHPRSLLLEVTESALMGDINQSIALLHRMREKGFTLCIDDFGTGYSSLTYLKKLPADVLKIDMSFVRRMASDHKDQMIVETIIALSHKLGIKVVAEGVEDPLTIKLLDQAQCDEIQGYYLSKGIPPVEALEYCSQFDKVTKDLDDLLSQNHQATLTQNRGPTDN